MPFSLFAPSIAESAQRRKGAKSAKKTFAFLPCLALFAPWRSWRASEAKRTFGEIGMEPERGVRGSTRLQKKEMKGPQGLGDAGAEAKTERAFSRVSELLLGAFADRPPYRRTLHAASPGVERLAEHGFRMCSVLLEKHGCREQAETTQVANECTTAAVPDGHSGVNYSTTVYVCQCIFTATIPDRGASGLSTHT
jgi:hypothetical protein